MIHHLVICLFAPQMAKSHLMIFGTKSKGRRSSRILKIGYKEIGTKVCFFFCDFFFFWSDPIKSEGEQKTETVQSPEFSPVEKWSWSFPVTKTSSRGLIFSQRIGWTWPFHKIRLLACTADHRQDKEEAKQGLFLPKMCPINLAPHATTWCPLCIN